MGCAKSTVQFEFDWEKLHRTRQEPKLDKTDKERIKFMWEKIHIHGKHQQSLSRKLTDRIFQTNPQLINVFKDMIVAQIGSEDSSTETYDEDITEEPDNKDTHDFRGNDSIKSANTTSTKREKKVTASEKNTESTIFSQFSTGRFGNLAKDEDKKSQIKHKNKNPFKTKNKNTNAFSYEAKSRATPCNACFSSGRIDKEVKEASEIDNRYSLNCQMDVKNKLSSENLLSKHSYPQQSSSCHLVPSKSKQKSNDVDNSCNNEIGGYNGDFSITFGSIQSLPAALKCNYLNRENNSRRICSTGSSECLLLHWNSSDLNISQPSWESVCSKCSLLQNQDHQSAQSINSKKSRGLHLYRKYNKTLKQEGYLCTLYVKSKSVTSDFPKHYNTRPLIKTIPYSCQFCNAMKTKTFPNSNFEKKMKKSNLSNERVFCSNKRQSKHDNLETNKHQDSTHFNSISNQTPDFEFINTNEILESFNNKPENRNQNSVSARETLNVEQRLYKLNRAASSRQSGSHREKLTHDQVAYLTDRFTEHNSILQNSFTAMVSIMKTDEGLNSYCSTMAQIHACMPGLKPRHWQDLITAFEEVFSEIHGYMYEEEYRPHFGKFLKRIYYRMVMFSAEDANEKGHKRKLLKFQRKHRADDERNPFLKRKRREKKKRNLNIRNPFKKKNSKNLVTYLLSCPTLNPGTDPYFGA